MNKNVSRFSRFCFRILRRLVLLFYPKISVEGLERLPKEPCILVGNHSQIHGPIIGELFFPGDNSIWCASQMLELKTVPAYAYKDFWSYKPRYIRWFYKALSYVIAPLAVCLLNNAHTIGVYRDSRALSTFRQTFRALDEGRNIIIFPECYEPHNNIINGFQTKFVDVAKFYGKKTGKTLSFVPMYIAPKLKKVCLGPPVSFDAQSSIEEERERICQYVMDSISDMARALPRHTVVPYANVSKKDYPVNTASEEITKP